jgi:carboxymethylenebutenolidase
VILTESVVDLATPTGAMRTYVVRPAAPGRYPGLVFYSEIFQRTPPIARMAALLAGHGHVVCVPEIFHELEPPGSVIPYDKPGTDRGNAHKLAKPIAAFDDDTRAVCDWLVADAGCTGKLGAFGVCIGGHLAYRAALEPRLRAAACVYATDLHKASLGRGGDDSLARAKDLRAEMLLVWGRQDPHIPADGRAKIHAALTDANVSFAWHEFNAQHAFMRDEGHRYDPALALTVYRLALDLFARTLA